MDYQILIDKALEAREKAYVPYSKFKVGSAVLFESGDIYSGCNIENASYGATNCAERTAIFKGVSEGNKIIKAIAIVGDIRTFTMPCGLCRQVMSEFIEDENTPVILVKNRNEYIIKTFDEVMPGTFTKKDLDY